MRKMKIDGTIEGVGIGLKKSNLSFKKHIGKEGEWSL